MYIYAIFLDLHASTTPPISPVIHFAFQTQQRHEGGARLEPHLLFGLVWTCVNRGNRVESTSPQPEVK